MKIALSEKIALLLHSHVDVPYSLVCYITFTLNGKLCLCDEKNAAFASLAVADEHGKRYTKRAHLPETVSDWLNQLSLGTMSASGYIENLA